MVILDVSGPRLEQTLFYDGGIIYLIVGIAIVISIIAGIAIAKKNRKKDNNEKNN